MTKTKTCQNCKTKFTIEPEDFEFYKKIGVPAPTFCPECRMARRMAFRNEINLYKRKCDATSKDIISIYNPKSPHKIYDHKYWWSDKWDALEYARNYDFSKPFFKQFQELFLKTPQISISIDNTVINSSYCNSTVFAKNCYLVTNSGEVENVVLSNRVTYCKDSMDLYIADKLELCCECLYCYDSYKLFFSNHCHSCVESYFLYDCRNCQNCFGCVNLRNKKYHIFNKPYSKAEYFKKLKEFDLGIYNNLIKQKENYQKIYKKAIHRFTQIIKSVNSVGNELKNTKNCLYAFDVNKTEDAKFINWGGFGCKDVYDCGPGFAIAELLYEVVDTGPEAAKNLFVIVSWHNQNIQYSINCHSSSNLFACVGLRHKQYCILNKQYTKDEYNELVPKIIEHMNKMPYVDKKGRIYKYGEFFPIELSPFAYNETIANEYFPLTKEQAIKQGYSWYDKPKAEYKPTIKAKDLEDNIKDVNNSILKEVIECDSKQCAGSGVFRIIPQELKFYKKMNLPIPRLCPDCRHRERIKQRNPLKLWERKCQCAGTHSSNKLYKNTTEHKHKNKPCSNKFQTTYAPDRPEIVYCEECYLKEVG